MFIHNRWMALVFLAGMIPFSERSPADEPPPFPESVQPAPAAGRANSNPIDEPVSLEWLQQQALQYNPTLEQAKSETWKAFGRQTQALLYPNPKLGYTGQEIGDSGTAGMQGFYVSQRLVTGGKLQLDRDIAIQEQRQAEQVVAAQEYRILNEIRKEYYALLTADRKIELSQELLAIARESEKQNERRLQALQGSRIDVLQARLERERVELTLANDQVERQAVVRRLQTLTGMPGHEDLRVTGDLEQDVPDLQWEETASRLEQMSPLVARAEAGVNRAIAAWKRQKAQPIPDVTIQAGTTHDFVSGGQVANLQVSLPVPLFDKNQGNISAAEAEWARASKEVERVRWQLRVQLANVFREYAQQRIRILKYNTEILPASWETLDLSRKALEGAEFDSLQFLTVQRTYIQFNREYIESLGEIWQKIVAIDGLLLLDGLQAPPSLP